MLRALIADDLPQNLYMLEVLLKTNGFEVNKASDGAEALKIAHEIPPSLIISDILMPGMDGFNLCKTWKADPELSTIPFVFYTATYTDPRDEKLALSLGADRFLVKPMEVDQFLQAIQEVLDRSKKDEGVVPVEDAPKDEYFYKEYNEALIRKLEDKMMELQKANKKLVSLYQASCDLHAPKPLANLMPGLLKTIVEVAGYEQIAYYSYNKKEEELVFTAASGFPEEEQQQIKRSCSFNLKKDKCIVCKVARSQQPYIINDTSQESDWTMGKLPVKSALLNPVVLNKSLQGMICLFSPSTNSFSEEDKLSISVLANNVAIALDNNSNTEQVKKQLERISVLHNIDLAISNSMDLNTTLNIFLEHVQTQLQIDACTILLKESNADKYKISAKRGFKTSLIAENDIRQGTSFDKQVTKERKVITHDGLAHQNVTSSFAEMWKSEGFTSYVGIPLITKGEVVGVLEIYNRSVLDRSTEWLDFLSTLAGQATIAIDNSKMFSELQSSHSDLVFAYDATIKGWSRAMDLRDRETEGHTQRVTDFAIRFARKIGIKQESIIHVYRGALLHDMGKLGVPDDILFKPGPLSESEWMVMRQHPQIAYEMLSPIDYLKPALDIPYCHHEKWDGSGYPRGLKGEEIPLAARLFALVDVWDALSSDRPYRKAWTKEKVITYIKEQSGSHFDPDLVNDFIQLIENTPREAY